MYGNPFYNQMNQQNSVDRINQQIQELEKLKSNYQNMPQIQQQPPMNVINVGNTSQNDFKAQFIDKNTKVEDLLVQCKTAFISPENGFLKVKEINGDITTYELIPPMDEKDKKIKELEDKLNELKLNKSISKGKSTADDTKYDKE